MSTRLRILTSSVGPSGHFPGEVVTFTDDTAAANLINAGDAIADPVDISTAYASALTGAGYSSLGVAPSGYRSDCPGGGYFKVDSNHFLILTPTPQRLVDVVLVDIKARY